LNPIFESYFWASTIYGNALGDLLAGHISSYKKATRFYKENKNQVIVPLNELSKILNITDSSGNIVQLVASSSYDEIQSLRSVIVTSLQTEQSVLGNLESVKGALLAKGLNPKILDTIKMTTNGNIYFQFDDQLKLEGGIPVYDISDERAFRTVTKAERVKDKTKRALFIGSTVTSPL
jgi:hypothetical protein